MRPLGCVISIGSLQPTIKTVKKSSKFSSKCLQPINVVVPLRNAWTKNGPETSRDWLTIRAKKIALGNRSERILIANIFTHAKKESCKFVNGQESLRPLSVRGCRGTPKTSPCNDSKIPFYKSEPPPWLVAENPTDALHQPIPIPVDSSPRTSPVRCSDLFGDLLTHPFIVPYLSCSSFPDSLLSRLPLQASSNRGRAVSLLQGRLPHARSHTSPRN